ncbi:hypothetical protein JCM11251_002284 [Rhodosporidiobolus azoricus]
MDATDTTIQRAENAPVTGYYEVVWQRLGTAAEDTSLLERPSVEERKEVLLAALLASTTAATPLLTSSSLLKGAPVLPIGLHKILAEQERQRTEAVQAPTPGAQIPFQAPEEATAPAYEAQHFNQLVSHDPEIPPPAENETFKQRYWFDAQFYKPGGPVILLDAGETDGANRIPFLEKGILRILGEATGGIGVVFEHRYYGESFPVKNLSTDSMRYLTTLQSLHDQVHFARNIVFPGLEHLNLTAPETPYLVYGGSYAGAKTAFARKLFPDVFWGGVASSAVTTAIVDYWQYYEPIRLNGPPKCISRLINHTSLIDSLLTLNSPFVTSSLKSFFGLPNVTLDEDFVNALALPLGGYQGQNWDPLVGSHLFQSFCHAIEEDQPSASVLSPLEPLEKALDSLVHLLPDWPKDPRSRFAAFSSYAGFIKSTIAAACPEGQSQDSCFGTDDFGGIGLEESGWRSWSYQFCQEWGYFIGAAPEGHPSLVSRLITPDYTGQICRKAFPPGNINRVLGEPNVTAINQYGSFNLSYPRLAFIDGSADPWLYATPHSPTAPNPNRKDTLKRPFKVIKGGVHHWDENGLLPPQSEPAEIAKIHEEEVEFVKEWMLEWKARGRWRWKGGAKEVGKWD